MNGIILGIVIAAVFLALVVLAFYLYLKSTGLFSIDLLYRGLFALVRASLSRGKQNSVRLELDGDVLEISNISAQEQRDIIDRWIKLQEQRKPDQQAREHKSGSEGVEE